MNDKWMPYPDREYEELAQVRVCVGQGSFGLSTQCIWCNIIRKVNGDMYCLHNGLPLACFEIAYFCHHYQPFNV